MALTEPIRDITVLRRLAEYWLGKGNLRNYLLIVLGTSTILRPCDLLSLTWDKVYDFKSGVFRTHISLAETKTGKNRVIAINNQAKKALGLYFPHRKGNFLFPGNRKNKTAISRIQAWRIVRAAAEGVDAPGVALYSLRKTAGYHAYKSGVSPALLMTVFNHSSFDITKRYLGITQDEIDGVYLSAVLF